MVIMRIRNSEQIADTGGDVTCRVQVVGARGFEPPASCSQSRRAARLRHAPIVDGYQFGLSSTIDSGTEQYLK